MGKLLICLFGPSLLGGAAATILFFRDSGASQRNIFDVFNIFQIVVSVGFVFTFIPSIAYFFIMEAWFRRRSSPSYFQTILVSALIGGFSGVLIGAVINPEQELFTFAVIGLVVGVFLGPVLEVLTRRSEKSGGERLEEAPLER